MAACPPFAGITRIRFNGRRRVASLSAPRRAPVVVNPIVTGRIFADARR